jgi:hypothetical protein
VLARLSLIAVLLAVQAAQPSPAAAHPGKRQGLTFQDVRPLKIEWTELKTGVPPVNICNLDSEPAEHVVAGLVGFGFRRDKKLVGDANLLKQPAVPTAVAEGDCKPVRIAINAKAKPNPKKRPPDDGTYTGILVVTSGGGGGSRRRVEVNVGEAAPETSKPKGLSDPLSLTAKHDWVWKEVTLDKRELLLARAQPGKPRLKLPPEDTQIGTLTKGADVASVYVDGQPKRHVEEGYILLPIRIEGIGYAGDYSGSVNLAADPKDDPQTLKLSVGVTDRPWLAVAAVLFGVVVALLPQVYWRRWHVAWKLKGRTKRFSHRYQASARLMAQFAGIRPPARDQYRPYKRKVRKAISDDMNSSLYFDPKSDSFKSITAAIELAEDDADYVRSDSGLAKHLQDLNEALDNFVKLDRPSAFQAAAKTVLQDGTLEVGEGLARGKKADEYLELVPVYNRLAGTVAVLESWAAELHTRHAHLTEYEQHRLLRADARVQEAKEELLTVTDEEGLDKANVAADLAHARGVLEALHQRLATRPTPAQSTLSFDFTEAAKRVIEGDREQASRLDEGTLNLHTQAARPCTLHKSVGGFVIDGLIILVSLAAGVIAALTTFYFGDSWGSTADYFEVIFAGGAAALITGAVADTVTNAAIGSRTAKLAKPVEAAAAEPDRNAALRTAIEAA